MTHISIKKNSTKNISFFLYLCSIKGTKKIKKTRNAFKIELVLIMLSNEEERYLKKIWTDTTQPAAFSGPYKLYQIVKREGKHKIGLQRIKQFLSDTDAYSLQSTTKI